MTDNEKRAHDLAIAAIPVALDEIRNSNSESGPIEFHLDETYCRFYQIFLERMKKRFPESER